MAFRNLTKLSNAVSASDTEVTVIGTMDISDMTKFSVQFINSSTAVAFLDLKAQVSHAPADSASDTAPAWVDLNTTTLPVPSALGVTATVMSTAVENSYHYLRFLGKTDASATAGFFNVIVGGIQH